MSINNEAIDLMYNSYQKLAEQLNKRNEKAIQKINQFQKEATKYPKEALIQYLVNRVCDLEKNVLTIQKDITLFYRSVYDIQTVLMNNHLTEDQKETTEEDKNDKR